MVLTTRIYHKQQHMDISVWSRQFIYAPIQEKLFSPHTFELAHLLLEATPGHTPPKHLINKTFDVRSRSKTCRISALIPLLGHEGDLEIIYNMIKTAQVSLWNISLIKC